MLKWLKREKIAPIYLEAGDTIELRHKNSRGVEETVMREDIGKTMVVDEAGVFTFEDEFDMEEGVGGVFGKAKL